MHFSRREFLVRGATSAAALWLPGRGLAQPRPPLSYGGFSMGLQSFTLRKLPLEPMLDAVQRLGLSQVELIPETKLLFYEFGSHFPVTEDPGEIARVQASARRSAASGSRRVACTALPTRPQRSGCSPSPRPQGFLSSPSCPTTRRSRRSTGCARSIRSVKLGIHNHGPYFRYDKIADVEQTLAGRHPNFGACVDAGHFIRSGEDPAEAVRRLGPRVHGVHLKDFRSEGFFAEGCLLGEGKLDLDGFFRALRAVDFAPGAALSLEYEEHADDPMAEIEACLRAASESAERVARG